MAASVYASPTWSVMAEIGVSASARKLSVPDSTFHNSTSFTRWSEGTPFFPTEPELVPMLRKYPFCPFDVARTATPTLLSLGDLPVPLEPVSFEPGLAFDTENVPDPSDVMINPALGLLFAEFVIPVT